MTTATTQTPIRRAHTTRLAARSVLWAACAVLIALGAGACANIDESSDPDGALTLSPERPQMSLSGSQVTDVHIEAEAVTGERFVEEIPLTFSDLEWTERDAAETLISGARPAEAFIDEYCDAQGGCFTVIAAPDVSGPVVSGPRPTWHWSRPAGAAGFLFRIDDAAEYTEVSLNVTGHRPDDDLAPGLHTFEIAAIDSDGNLSELARFQTRVERHDLLTTVVDSELPQRDRF